MKNIALSVVVLAALCAASAWASCAILEDDNWKLYDVSDSYFNTSDTFGIVSANLCLDMEKSCSHTTDEPCSICQYITEESGFYHSYCLGYSRDEEYSELNATYLDDKLTGFRATLFGDSDWCENNQNRISKIDVICSQTRNELIFEGEYPGCTYNFRLNLKQNCQISPASFTPTFTLTSLTPNSLGISIDAGYPWMFWNYNVKLNDKYGYQGTERDIVIENLDAGTTYEVVVERESGYGAVIPIISPSTTKKISTLQSNIGSGFTAVVNGQGTGIIIGMFIAIAILGALFGLYKFTKTDFFQERFGGGKTGGKGFSLMDAEKSSAFE